MDESGGWSTAFRRRGPSLVHVGFVVDEIVLRQVFWEYVVCPKSKYTDFPVYELAT